MYRVYYCELTETSSSASNGSYSYLNRTLIYDTSQVNTNNSLIIYDPVLIREVNEAGSFEADIPTSNQGYNLLTLILGVIEVFRDGKMIWEGRITQIDIDFNLNKHIYCEGALSYLNDDYKYINWNDILVEYQNNGVTEYLCYWNTFFDDYCNSTIYENGKAIYTNMGDLNSGFASWMNENAFNYIEFKCMTQDDRTDDSPCMSAWDAFKTVLIDKFLETVKNNVFFYLDYQSNSSGSSTIYRRELQFAVINDDGDLLCGEMPLTDQTIEFGKNLLDINISYNVDMSTICSRARVYGYTTKGWWIFKKTNFIYGQFENTSLSSKYGIFERYDYVDGQTVTQDYLDIKAVNFTNEHKVDEIAEIEVKAVDLADAGENVDHLDFMCRTRIISEPHGIDMILPCVKLVEPLDDPSSKEFTFGKTRNSITKDNYSTGITAQRAHNVGSSVKSWVVGNNS